MIRKATIPHLAKRQWIIGLLLGAMVVVIFLLLQANFAAAVQSPASNFFPNEERIIYLASSDQTANTDLPVPVQGLQQKGVVVVYDVNQLKQLIEDNAVDAIILHASRRNEIADLYLPELYQKGVVIAGIDMTVHELAAMVDDKFLSNDPAWTDGWQKSPFFSIIAAKSTGTREEQMMAQRDGIFLGNTARQTDNLLSAQSVDYFLMFVRADIEMVKATP